MVGDKIAFLDLVTQHQEIREELVAAFNGVLETASFVGGPAVDRFETAFALFCEARHCVGVGSGTDALRFALIAAGVRPGDAVVTVPHTFIATTEAISQAGGVPEFVDIDERTYNMDPEKLREYLEADCVVDDESGKLVTLRERRPVTAIVPVHLYGQMADMDPILDLAKRFGLLVVEDACQAHGAEYFSKSEGRWKRAGSMGYAAAFSFYPGKNLGACGEAGAIVTNNASIARVCGMLRDHGQAQKYYHDMEGYNGRLDALQAEFLRIKLGHVNEWNAKRRRHAKRYEELFAEGSGLITVPYEAPYSRSVYHLYVIRTHDRETLRSRLAADGIGTGIHYPIPLHLQKAYRNREFSEGNYPVTERVASEILSLPMFPSLSAEQQDRVVEKVLQCVARPTAGIARHAVASLRT
jgi:dTDP-4-amino-4,6-dideoxygalactose transaminase